MFRNFGQSPLFRRAGEPEALAITPDMRIDTGAPRRRRRNRDGSRGGSRLAASRDGGVPRNRIPTCLFRHVQPQSTGGSPVDILLTASTRAFAAGESAAGTKSRRSSLAALRGFLDCYEGSEECGMVLSHGVYEKGTVNGTKFISEAKALGMRVR